MGQSQARASKVIDDEPERESGAETEDSSRIKAPGSHEVTPPLAPVFGSPIDSKKSMIGRRTFQLVIRH